MEFSVLMSVYMKEKPQYLKESIESIINQTVKPNEIIILKDGKLTKELDDTIQSFKKKYNDLIKVISFDKNRGLGETLRDGVKLAKYDLIARMDSDDISEPDRFEIQIEKFKTNPKLDIVGGSVSEFIGSKENVISYKKLPENNQEIYEYSHRRNPFAHPTVMFKKNKVLEAGNYRNYYLCEDYDLWIRMIKNNAQCYNVQKKLVNMRINEEFYKRRGGIKYLRSMLKFKKEQMNTGYFTKIEYIKTIIPHIIVCLLPNSIRDLIYRKLLRKSK